MSNHRTLHRLLVADSPAEREMIRQELVAQGHHGFMTDQEWARFTATGELPGPYARHAAHPPKRSDWTWPLVALVILLGLVAGGAVAAILLGGS